MTAAWLDAEGASLVASVRALIASFRAGAPGPFEVDPLALALFRWQRTRSETVSRIARAFLGDRDPESLDELPAVPTDVFKSARVACFPSELTARVFRTSGTTREVRGEHPFADLSLYAEAALASAERWLLPCARYRFVCVAPDEREAPDSSLSFMLARFVERWAPEGSRPFVVRGGRLDVEAARISLEGACREGLPVALLGATWGFVHLLDALGSARFELPPGSVAMPTGGSKGRARELAPEALQELLEGRFGLGSEAVVGEYGMTELSSQAYETSRPGSSRGGYRAPPWMLVHAVDPESLAPLPHGTSGLLRVLDLANVGSTIAVQTSDLGRTWADGFEVLGRAPGATPRGCARALDALLSSA